MRRNVPVVTGAVLGALMAVILFAATAQATESREGMVREEFHQTYPLAMHGQLALKNVNGDVRIAAWDRSEVKVDAIKFARTKERLNEAKILVDAKPDSIFIQTKYPDHELTFHSDDDHDNPATVDYVITVPRNARLDKVDLVNGALTIGGVAGEVRAASVNGNVTATALAGPAHLSAVNGTLEAQFQRLPPKPLTFSCVNGRMRVTLPSDAQATLRASTVNGAIDNDFGLPVQKGRYVGRKLEGRLGNGGADITLKNVNGTVAIMRADDGKPPSNATNLLPQTQGAEYMDDAEDEDSEL